MPRPRTIVVGRFGRRTGVGIGSGIHLALNEVSTDAAVEQLLAEGRLTLPNTVDLRDVLDAEARRP